MKRQVTIGPYTIILNVDRIEICMQFGSGHDLCTTLQKSYFGFLLGYTHEMDDEQRDYAFDELVAYLTTRYNA